MTASGQDCPQYGIDIRWSEEDEAFVAVSPEWEGLSGIGVSPSAAVRELEAAIVLAIETYRDEGWSLPSVRTLSDFSGQFRVRLPRSLHAWLAQEAEREGVSLNTFVIARLSEARGARASVQEGSERRARA